MTRVAVATTATASWQRKTKQKVSQKFSHGSGISFPTLTADNAVVEPLTIEINAAGHDIHRMYIDGGASADILYEHCFQRLRPKVKSQLNPATTSLTGFTGEKIWPMGQIRLPVMVGNKEHSTTAWMNFMVIRSPSPYNGIIGRPGISPSPSNRPLTVVERIDIGQDFLIEKQKPDALEGGNVTLKQKWTSHLVANHSGWASMWQEDNMIQYLDKTKSLKSRALIDSTIVKFLERAKSISDMEKSTGDRRAGSTWMTPIIEFISKGTLPHEQKDARRIRRTAQRFELRNGVLYRRSFLQPWLRCVRPIQADYVLADSAFIMQ
ncbi:reverse transcriptase domain-containing protein [Tanacetum coccineum]